MRHALDCGLCCGLAECDCGVIMNETRATEILSERNALSDSSGLYNLGWYLSWTAGDADATLDGTFDADELEAIAWWMRNKGQAKI